MAPFGSGLAWHVGMMSPGSEAVGTAYQYEYDNMIGTMWTESRWHHSGNIVTETTADVSRSRREWHD